MYSCTHSPARKSSLSPRQNGFFPGVFREETVLAWRQAEAQPGPLLERGEVVIQEDLLFPEVAAVF